MQPGVFIDSLTEYFNLLRDDWEKFHDFRHSGVPRIRHARRMGAA